MPVVEVFADVVCPFTHVGLCRLVQRRAELGRDDVRLLVRAWPLELVNGAPMDPVAVEGKIADLRAQVAPDLFTGFRRDAFPATSLPALALTAAAYERSIEAGEAVALEVRRLLFEEGADVADPAVLARVADAHGVEVPQGSTAVERDYADGRERGVRGSPHFFPPSGVDVFCPTLDIERVDGHLVVHVDPARFDELVHACFA